MATKKKTTQKRDPNSAEEFEAFVDRRKDNIELKPAKPKVKAKK